MKFTIEENDKTTEIDGAAMFIQHELNRLYGYRDDGRIPSKELLYDIAIYEFIVNDADPAKRADEYIRNMEAKNWSASKMDCAKALGWPIDVCGRKTTKPQS